jgi:hypothetical protein
MAYICFDLADASVGEQVRVTGIRWTVEESIQTGKGEVGLDHYLDDVGAGVVERGTSRAGCRCGTKKRLLKASGPSSLRGFKARRNLRSD